MIFKKLTIDLCRCEIVSETNALDYCCDEVADQFELVKPSRRLEYICTPALYPLSPLFTAAIWRPRTPCA